MRAERLLTSANARDLKDALRLAHDLCSEAHPDSPEAQCYLAAAEAAPASQLALERSRRRFRRGGMPGDDHPELLFYLAVSLYESGDPTAAAAALKRSLPNLQRPPMSTAASNASSAPALENPCPQGRRPRAAAPALSSKASQNLLSNCVA